MERAQLTTIAYRDHRFMAPLDPADVDRLIERAALPAGARVLDLGCGKGELLVRLVERWGARAVGVDRSADRLAEARARAAGRIPADALELVEADAAGFTAPGPFALVACIGATFIFGGFGAAVERLGALAAPGGLVLVGDALWARPPDPQYLARLGASPEDLPDLDAQRAALARFTILDEVVSSVRDWRHHEELYADRLDAWAAAHADDPDVAQVRARADEIRELYMRWGADTLGFATFLARASGTELHSPAPADT